MLNSKALTKIQSIVLVAIIILASIGGGVYLLLSGESQTSETIKIGVLVDLDGANGKDGYQAAILAAEQINAEGGILGRKVEIIGEDTDTDSGVDMAKVSSALTRLLTYHNVDFVITGVAGEAGFVIQDMMAEHKKIVFSSANTDEFTQRVLDDYNKYKYFFRVGFNESSALLGIPDSLLRLREQTGFNKVGYLAEDLGWTKGARDGLDYLLPEVYGFDLVYNEAFPLGTVDFSSYFASAEAAGVEILVPLIALDGGIAFTKEWYNRQSPMVIHSGILFSVSNPESWVEIDGKCEYVTFASYPLIAGYPLTSKTIPAREAYLERWGVFPGFRSVAFYDTIRFILPDAIDRAGKIETEAVIKALEDTSIETSSAKNFIFTSSHDLMMGINANNPDADYTLIVNFQWQNGEMVPVHPQKIMEEAGATYLFPPWDGPWD